MKKQRGQSAVEFALMAPIIFMMIFGMIYGGIMFIEYMHYSNAVRTAAREIAVSPSDKRADKIADRTTWLKNLWKEEVSVPFYEPQPLVDYKETTKADGSTEVTTKETDMIAVDGGDVVITIAFVMDDNVRNSMPYILRAMDFPPRTIKTLQYRMKLEGGT